jgi:hypothetical protein
LFDFFQLKIEAQTMPGVRPHPHTKSGSTAELNWWHEHKVRNTIFPVQVIHVVKL